VTSFFEIALTNAVVATVLAVMVAAASRLLRRPAGAHALWLLVLIKLVTPPLCHFSVPCALPWNVQPVVWQDAGLRTRADLDPLASLKQSQATIHELPADAIDSPHPHVVSMPATSESTRTRANSSTAATADSRLAWKGLAGGVWAIGVVSCFALAGWRIARFHRTLRWAVRATPDLQEEAAAIARKLGLSHCPQVWLLPGVVSPMLWALTTTPRLLLGSAVWSRLSAEQRSTMLAHELAHYLRGDHWVRLLEMVVTALYWWHPVAWWARRQLREAEEECCDAWVVWAFPDCARQYATALMDILESLTRSPAALPTTASGIGQARLLKRRLTMIMRGTTSRFLSTTGCVAVVLIGAGVLPWLPIAQSKSAAEGGDLATQRPLDPAASDSPKRADLMWSQACLQCHENPHVRNADPVAPGHQRVIELGQQVSQLKKQVLDARAALDASERKLAKAERELADAISAFGANQRATGQTPSEGPEVWRSERHFAKPEARRTDLEKKIDALAEQLNALRQEAKTMRDTPKRSPGGPTDPSQPVKDPERIRP
jgi:beta-lactamase regulating signal transducer with metallopeptidase domain